MQPPWGSDTDTNEPTGDRAAAPLVGNLLLVGVVLVVGVSVVVLSLGLLEAAPEGDNVVGQSTFDLRQVSDGTVLMPEQMASTAG